MSKFVKENLTQIAISGIRQFNQKAEQIEGVVKLTLGELDFNTPEPIKDAVLVALSENKTRYTLNAGIEELRKKIVLKYDHYNDREIIMTVGTTEGLSTVIKSIINPGDEVIIPTPGYVGYEPLIMLDGGIVSPLDIIKTNFKITKDSLEEAYTNKTKAMIITNPNNPTGLILDQVEMDLIKNFVLEKDILLISDEIYSDIDFTKTFKSFTEYPELKENLVALNGFSKSHAMTGFRIGFMLSDELMAKHLLKTHQYSVTSATSISQYAALKACDIDNSEMIEELKHRRDFVLSKLDELNLPYITPMGAFYIFIDISKYSNSSTAFCEKLLYIGRVACIPGESFLGDHKKYIRLSYATSMENLEEAMKRIALFLEKI